MGAEGARLEPGSLTGTTGEVELTDPSFNPVSYYQSTDTAVYVDLVDADTGDADTATVTIASDTEAAGGVSETVTLTETGVDTGIFRGSIPLSLDGPASGDGALAVAVGDTITLTYEDAANDFGHPVTITKEAIMVGTVVLGTLSVDTTWSLEGSPYLLVGDVTLLPGRTLILEPGVSVLFLAFTDILESGSWRDRSELTIGVGGTLDALGTPSNPVIFTSTNSPAEPGDWGAIRLDSGAGGTLSDC